MKQPQECCTAVHQPVLRPHLHRWYGDLWLMCDWHHQWLMGVHWYALMMAS